MEYIVHGAKIGLFCKLCVLVTYRLIADGSKRRDVSQIMLQSN